MDSISLYSMIAFISVVVFIIGMALMIVSIVLTAKKKRKFAVGIICGVLLMIAGVVFTVFGLINALTATLDAAMDLVPLPTSFTPAEGSRPVSGTLKIDGHEVTMPCTVSDLQNMGYVTDYEYFDHTIGMWPLDNKNGKIVPPHFDAYIDNSYGYKSYDHVKGDDHISAIRLQDDWDIEFEFNDLKYGMSKEAFLEIYGTPAYEIDNPQMGDFLYYVGENDTIYRFKFGNHYGGDSDYLIGIMYGTSEYMEYEMNGLYH